MANSIHYSHASKVLKTFKYLGQNLNNTALALDVLHDLRRQRAVFCKTHVSREGAARLPLGGGSRRGFLQHAVDLLKREALRLRDQEVGVNEARRAQRTPNEEHLRLKVALVRADHVGGDDRDDAVP